MVKLYVHPRLQKSLPQDFDIPVLSWLVIQSTEFLFSLLK